MPYSGYMLRIPFQVPPVDPIAKIRSKLVGHLFDLLAYVVPIDIAPVAPRPESNTQSRKEGENLRNPETYQEEEKRLQPANGGKQPVRSNFTPDL